MPADYLRVLTRLARLAPTACMGGRETRWVRSSLPSQKLSTLRHSGAIRSDWRLRMSDENPHARVRDMTHRDSDGTDQLATYTGVVVIHGIGDQRRSATLEEILNALVYWYRERAGLDLQPTGAGRVWLSTHLSDATDPDARAAGATLELVAPSTDAAGASACLRLIVSATLPATTDRLW